MRGFVIGTLVTLPAALIAFIAAGAGHGDYVFTRILFPYSLLLTRVTGDRITTPLLWLGGLQFPIYGAALGISAPRWRRAVAGALVVVHSVVAAVCFTGILREFG